MKESLLQSYAHGSSSFSYVICPTSIPSGNCGMIPLKQIGASVPPSSEAPRLIFL